MNVLTILFLTSHGVNAIIALILIITTIRLYVKTKIRLVLLLTVLMGSWMITNTLLVIPILFDGFNVSNNIANNPVALIATWNIIGSAVVPSIFIIFVDAFEGEIDPRKTSIAIATLVVSVFIGIIGYNQYQVNPESISIASTIVVVEGLITMRWSPIASLAIFPTVIMCGIWTQRELRKSKIHAIDEKQLRQITFMQIGGALMFFIGPAFGIAGVVAVDGFGEEVVATYLSEIIGYMFVSIGIIMITLAYTTSDAVAFLQPQRMDSLIAIFSTGIPILQYDFSPQEGNKTDVSLISGAITAIMSEAFNVQSDVRQIAFYDKELVLDFETSKSGVDVAFVLITDRVSSYLEAALSRFSKEFVELIPEDAVNGTQLTEQEYHSSVSLLRKSFGLSSLDTSLN